VKTPSRRGSVKAQRSNGFAPAEPVTSRTDARALGSGEIRERCPRDICAREATCRIASRTPSAALLVGRWR
jgi:hypothetical protein